MYFFFYGNDSRGGVWSVGRLKPTAGGMAFRVHPLARALTQNDRQAAARLLAEGWCDPNDAYLTRIGEEPHRRTPLQLALGAARSPCTRRAEICNHIDCLLSDPDSLLRLVIRHGANFNRHNYLIDFVLFYGPFRPLQSEDPAMLSDLERQMLALGGTEENFHALRFFYSKEQSLTLEFARACIEHGLRRDRSSTRTIVVTRTLALLAAMWPDEWDAARLRALQINLWLCGFDLATSLGDFPRVRTFHLLPPVLQQAVAGVMTEAIEFVQQPLALTLLARDSIRRAVPLANFRSSVLHLKLPLLLRRFVLFVEVI